MFTVEMDWDETAITLLDPEGKEEDIQVLMYDDIVYIRQYDTDYDINTVIAASPKQFEQLMYAFQLPAGAYITGDKK